MLPCYYVLWQNRLTMHSNNDYAMLLLLLLLLILASTVPLHLYAQDLAIPYPPPSSHIIHPLPHHYISKERVKYVQHEAQRER